MPARRRQRRAAGEFRPDPAMLFRSKWSGPGPSNSQRPVPAQRGRGCRYRSGRARAEQRRAGEPLGDERSVRPRIEGRRDQSRRSAASPRRTEVGLVSGGLGDRADRKARCGRRSRRSPRTGRPRRMRARAPRHAASALNAQAGERPARHHPQERGRFTSALFRF